MLVERRWVPIEPRHGDLKEVGDAVAAEIDASYPDGRLEALVKQAFEQGAGATDFKETRRVYTDEERDALLASSDWKQRYAAVESIGVDPAHFSELATAMKDPHISVRRMATIYLGLLKTPETLEPLVAALSGPARDTAAVIRRTAGDALNDLAPPYPARTYAINAMIEALGDKNKLVRWRAARFLYELGDASALPALKIAAEAPEFEVKLQALQAIERIEGGKEAAGPIWMQMTRK
jgi:HEAT repeat protein